MYKSVNCVYLYMLFVDCVVFACGNVVWGDVRFY